MTESTVGVTAPVSPNAARRALADDLATFLSRPISTTRAAQIAESELARFMRDAIDPNQMAVGIIRSGRSRRVGEPERMRALRALLRALSEVDAAAQRLGQNCASP